MEGIIKRGELSIGKFKIWLHGGGTHGWTGTAEISNLPNINGTVDFSWSGGYRINE